MLTLKQLQDELRPWVAHNFGERPSWQPLLGLQEEVGELAHSHLKAVQGIRTNQDHRADKIDAVADIVIFLADYCNAEEIDLQAALDETWAKIKLRDWKEKPEGAEKIGKVALERAEEIKALKAHHDEFIRHLKSYPGSLWQFVKELDGADNG